MIHSPFSNWVLSGIVQHVLDAMLKSSEDFLQHPTPLGADLYDRDRPKVNLPKKSQGPTMHEGGSEDSAQTPAKAGAPGKPQCMKVWAI